jgi:hypothetical protein
MAANKMYPAAVSWHFLTGNCFCWYEELALATVNLPQNWQL